MEGKKRHIRRERDTLTQRDTRRDTRTGGERHTDR